MLYWIDLVLQLCNLNLRVTLRSGIPNHLCGPETFQLQNHQQLLLVHQVFHTLEFIQQHRVCLKPLQIFFFANFSSGVNREHCGDLLKSKN